MIQNLIYLKWKRYKQCYVTQTRVGNLIEWITQLGKKGCKPPKRFTISYESWRIQDVDKKGK